MSVLTDIDIKRELGKNIVIQPISEESISPLGYDLRIGVVSLLHYPDRNPVQEGKIILPPAESIQILTKERVWLSPKIVGTLHSRGSFSALGLVLNSTTVDPNWKGQMTFLIYNSSHKEVEIAVESQFITLIFHYANTPTLTTPKTNPIRVADSHQFSRSVVEDAARNTAFEEEIQNAQKPDILELIQDKKVQIFNYLKSFVYGDVIQFIFISLFAVNLILMFGALFGLYSFIKDSLNLSGDYVPQVLVGQIALTVTLLVAIGRKKI